MATDIICRSLRFSKTHSGHFWESSAGLLSKTTDQNNANHTQTAKFSQFLLGNYPKEDPFC